MLHARCGVLSARHFFKLIQFSCAIFVFFVDANNVSLSLN